MTKNTHDFSLTSERRLPGTIYFWMVQPSKNAFKVHQFGVFEKLWISFVFGLKPALKDEAFYHWGIFLGHWEGQIMAQPQPRWLSKGIPPNPLSSGLGIILICPNGHLFFPLGSTLGQYKYKPIICKDCAWLCHCTFQLNSSKLT